MVPDHPWVKIRDRAGIVKEKIGEVKSWVQNEVW